jgi:hypothetical protein
MRRKLLLLFVLCLSMCVGGSASDVARIVKRFHLYNQTGAIGPITVYTPNRGGMFRVNAFMVITVGNVEGSVCATLGFATKFGPSRAGVGCMGTQMTGATNEVTAAVGDKGGNPLTLSVYTTGGVGAKYNVDIVVEEL